MIKKQKIRKTEESLAGLFSVCETIAPGIKRWKDDALPDMYDHNRFAYERALTGDDIRQMWAYQKERGDAFLKTEGGFPLANEFAGDNHLEAGCTLTMAIETTDLPQWTTNPQVEVRWLSRCHNEDEIISLELKNYGQMYGEDFVKRKMDRYFAVARVAPELDFISAYMNGRIEGYLFTYKTAECLALDGLIVNENARMQKVATTLIKEAVGDFSGIVYLHSDAEDTPRNMYEKMGFKVVDYLYEYLCK